jgi:hypothetical protein
MQDNRAVQVTKFSDQCVGISAWPGLVHHLSSQAHAGPTHPGLLMFQSIIDNPLFSSPANNASVESRDVLHFQYVVSCHVKIS